MLSEALDFPTSGSHGSAALLVGSALLLLTTLIGGASLFISSPVGAIVGAGVVLLLQIPIRGYYVRVLRTTAADHDPTAPSFRDVGSLLRDGLTAIVISLVYLLPATILLLLAAGGTLATAVENPLALAPTSLAATETLGSLAALFGLFGVLFGVYLVPGAVTMYAHERRVKSALALRSVLRGAFSEDYAVGWVVSLLVQAVIFPIAVALYPLLVGFILQFFLAVVVRSIWGSSFGAAMGFEPRTVDTEGLTPASGLTAETPSVENASAVSAQPKTGDTGHSSSNEQSPTATATDGPPSPSDREVTESPAPTTDEDVSEFGQSTEPDDETDTPADPMADESER